jgi:hypothetical protein
MLIESKDIDLISETGKKNVAMIKSLNKRLVELILLKPVALGQKVRIMTRLRWNLSPAMGLALLHPVTGFGRAANTGDHRQYLPDRCRRTQRTLATTTAVFAPVVVLNGVEFRGGLNRY